jgi:hypothetical protein
MCAPVCPGAYGIREVRCSCATSEIGAVSFATAKFLLSNKKIRIHIILVGCWYYGESGWIKLCGAE